MISDCPQIYAETIHYLGVNKDSMEAQHRGRYCCGGPDGRDAIERRRCLDRSKWPIQLFTPGSGRSHVATWNGHRRSWSREGGSSGRPAYSAKQFKGFCIAAPMQKPLNRLSNKRPPTWRAHAATPTSPTAPQCVASSSSTGSIWVARARRGGSDF